MDKKPRQRTNTSSKPAPAQSKVLVPARDERVLQGLLSQVIRRRRESLRVSQEAFADDIQMHRTYYSGIERGVRNMTLRSLERVADGLGEPLSKLIAEAERELVKR